MRTARPGAGADAGRGIVGPIRSLAREFFFFFLNRKTVFQ